MADTPDNSSRRLQTTPYTLAEFTKRGLFYYTTRLLSDLTVFGLTGEYTDIIDDSRRQAHISCASHCITDDSDIMVSRYYGSAFGISRSILVSVPITVHLDFPYLRALKSPTHVKREVWGNELPSRSIDYYRIPNFEFGAFGEKHSLNLAFPKLWSPERDKSSLPRTLTAAEYELWFEKGYVPAIRKLRINDTDINTIVPGRSWRKVPARLSSELMDEIRLELSSDINNPDWVRDFIVLHTIHEMKHAHIPSHESSESTLDRFLYDCGVHPDTSSLGEWYVDVGLEATSQRRLCLQWMTSAHSVLAKEALQSIDDDDAASLTCFGADGYFRDVVNHLDEVSGFRLFPPGSTRFPGDCRMVRAYTTDEDILGRANSTHGLTLTEVFKERFVRFFPTIEALIDTCVSARGEKPSKARLEVRAPLRHAHSALLDVDPSIFGLTLYAFQIEDWWNFRLTRLLVINEALLVLARSDTKLTPETLTLTAALLWLVNGSLPSHPKCAPALYRLLDAVLPKHDGNGPMHQGCTGDPSGSITHAAHQPPYIPFGCVFLRSLMHGACIPTFRGGDHALPSEVYEALLEGMSVGGMEGRYMER